MFFLTLAVYNISYFNSDADKSRKIIVILSLIGACVWSIINFSTLILNTDKWLITGFLTMFYLIPNEKIKLRNLPFLKSVFVSLIWSLVAVGQNQFSNFITIATFAFSFFLVYALIQPFDMRDSEIDSVKTIPNVFGAKTAISIAMIAIVLASAILLLLTHNIFISILNMSVFGGSILLSQKLNKDPIYLGFLEPLFVIQSIFFYQML